MIDIDDTLWVSEANPWPVSDSSRSFPGRPRLVERRTDSEPPSLSRRLGTIDIYLSVIDPLRQSQTAVLTPKCVETRRLQSRTGLWPFRKPDAAVLIPTRQTIAKLY